MLIYELLAVAYDGPVQIDILMSREFHIEARAQCQKLHLPLVDNNATGSRVHGPGNQLHQGGLTGTVRTYYADDFAFIDIESHMGKSGQIPVTDFSLNGLNQKFLDTGHILGGDTEIHADILHFDDRRFMAQQMLHVRNRHLVFPLSLTDFCIVQVQNGQLLFFLQRSLFPKLRLPLPFFPLVALTT